MMELFRKILRTIRGRHLIHNVYIENHDSTDPVKKSFAVFAIDNKRHATDIFDPDSKWSLAFLFGGTWPFEYFEKTYTVQYEEGMPFVQYREKKMFFPVDMTESQIMAYLRSVEVEQDRRSAHCYFPDSYDAEGKVILDIGAAEGIFSLEHIASAKKICLFEPSKRWIAPLKKTFEPWKDKVEIISTAAGDGTGGTITIDGFCNERQINPDLIKIDVDGMEMAVLKGAADLIRDLNKLKLLVCLYHNGRDENDIRGFLKDYDCLLREGYMCLIWERPLRKPCLRHGVAEFNRKAHEEIEQ